jgi:predicted SAM-dependent methyltransferase
MIEIARKVSWWLRGLVGITPEKANANFHRKRSPQLIAQYWKAYAIKKIQIGAQSNSISGWLNLDILPKSREVAYMDATQTFPFADNSVDYIYTEHMIEHITLQQGKFMIAECFRVLKPNGRIRIATPNLAFLMELYKREKAPVQDQYIEFSAQRYFKNQVPAEDVYVINNFFRDWGHQFIHDIKSLTYLLNAAGFAHIKQCQLGVSDDANFQQLEQHSKEIGDQFNLLETIIVEAQKV